MGQDLLYKLLVFSYRKVLSSSQNTYLLSIPPQFVISCLLTGQVNQFDFLMSNHDFRSFNLGQLGKLLEISAHSRSIH